MKTIVPVVTAHVGWVTLGVVGVLGGVGTELTVTLVADDKHVLSALLLVVKAWLPGDNPANVVDAWKGPPSTLYSKPAPSGAVIVTVPVGTAHVGCVVVLAVGAEGVAGTALTETFVAEDTQVLSVVLLVVKAWDTPGDNPAKVVDAWKGPPSTLYSKPAPSGAVIVTVPVGTAHVGCVVVNAVGAAGGVGTAFIVTVLAAGVEQVVSVLLRTLKV